MMRITIIFDYILYFYETKVLLFWNLHWAGGPVAHAWWKKKFTVKLYYVTKAMNINDVKEVKIRRLTWDFIL